MVLNGGGTIQNGQCSVNGAGSSAVLSGNNLTLALNVTFQASFTGNRILYAAGRDAAGGKLWGLSRCVKGRPALRQRLHQG